MKRRTLLRRAGEVAGVVTLSGTAVGDWQDNHRGRCYYSRSNSQCDKYLNSQSTYDISESCDGVTGNDLGIVGGACMFATGAASLDPVPGNGAIVAMACGGGTSLCYIGKKIQSKFGKEPKKIQVHKVVNDIRKLREDDVLIQVTEWK